MPQLVILLAYCNLSTIATNLSISSSCNKSVKVRLMSGQRPLIGGGRAYSYIRVLFNEFLLKSTVMTTDFKRNSSGRTRIYECAPPSSPPPQINALVTALTDVATFYFQTCYNLLKQLAASLSITSFDNQLATYNRLVVKYVALTQN